MVNQIPSGRMPRPNAAEGGHKPAKMQSGDFRRRGFCPPTTPPKIAFGGTYLTGEDENELSEISPQPS